MPEKIKGITVEIGGDTQGLKKALSSLNKDINSTQKELNQVNRLLKIDPGNTELLRQKQELLAKSIQDTETKIEALRAAKDKADADMANGTQVNEEQYRQLAREIISSENNLQKMKAEADRTASALKGVDEKPVEEVEAAAKDAEDALEDAGKEASNFGDYLKAGAIIEGAKGLADAMGEVVDGAKEYMQIMGTLETSSEAAGYSAQETEQSYKQLQGVLGDTQASATTLANLQAIGLSQKDLTAMIENSIGAWARYGDSIPIDGLAESINETVRAGQVTGTFADVLNWGSKEGETFGVTLKANTEANKEWNDAVNDAKTAEDFFNLALQDAGTQAERANLVMQAMADQGLAESSEAWRKNNEELVANNEANDAYQDSMAELAQEVLPIVTEITEAMAEFINFILDNKDTVVAALLGIGTALAVFKIGSLISSVVSGFSTFFGVIKSGQGIMAAFNAVLSVNPIVLLVGAIAALVAAFVYLWNNCEEFRNFWINLWDTISQAFSAAWDAIVGFFTETLPNAFNSVIDWVKNNWQSLVLLLINPFAGIFKLLYDNLDGFREFIDNIGASIYNAFVSFWNSIVSFFTETIPSWIASIGEWFAQIPYNIGYALGQAVGSVVKFGQDVWNWITVELPKIIAGVIDWFSQLPGQIWNWLLDTLDKVKQWGMDTYNSITKAASDMINGVIDWFRQLPGRIWDWLMDTVGRISSWGGNLYNTAVDAVRNTVNGIIEWFKKLPGEVYNIGKSIVEGIWNGITGMGDWLWGQISGFGQGIVDGFKNALGIHSPSKVMRDQIGKMLPSGIVLGVEDEMPRAVNQMDSMLGNLVTALSQFLIPTTATAPPELLTVSGNRSAVQPLTNQTTNNASFGNINVYVTTSSSDPAQTAQEIGEELQAQMQRRGMVFA